MNWRDIDAFDDAKHPDTPEPGDYTEPDEPAHQFDPQDDAPNDDDARPA